MCGIFGFVNSGGIKQEKAQELARNLANLSVERGQDAAGYATLEEGQIQITKKAVSAELLPIRLREAKIFVGHTRYATMGSPDSHSQAHPFLSSDTSFALTHNGVGTEDFEEMRDVLELEGEIDSQGITSFLGLGGIDCAGLADLYSFWSSSSIALAILSRETKSLILTRNAHKPLHYAKLDGLFVYASTREILEQALREAALPVCAIEKLKPLHRLEVDISGSVKIEAIALAARRSA